MAGEDEGYGYLHRYGSMGMDEYGNSSNTTHTHTDPSGSPDILVFTQHTEGREGGGQAARTKVQGARQGARQGASSVWQSSVHLPRH